MANKHEWYCEYCDAMRDEKSVYLDKYMTDGHYNNLVFCDICDSEIGVLYNAPDRMITAKGITAHSGKEMKDE